MIYKRISIVVLISFLTINFSFAQQKYAVLITGEYAGDDADTTGSWIASSDKSKWEEFWNDTYLMWEMLVFDKEYSDDNVFVLFAGGEDYTFENQADRYTAESHYGYTVVTDYPATKENVQAVFRGLKTGENDFPKLNENDFLFVYTFGHGDYTYGIDSSYHVVLTLMGYEWDLTHQTWDDDHSIADYELGYLLDSINCNKKVVFMQQCYSGGFIPFIEDTNTIIFSAANSEMKVRSSDQRYYDDIDYPGDPDPGNCYEVDEDEEYGTSIISYTINEPSDVLLVLYNTNGSIIKTIVNEVQNKGEKTATVNVNDLSNGVYYYSLKLDNEVIGVKKMVVMR